jgi:C-terminal processing protease CtpA/Prc
MRTQIDGTLAAVGYSPAYGQFNNTGDVFVIIEYVYPDSPADKAGLQRGDIILEINGQRLNENNFLRLNDDNISSIALGEYNGRTIVDANQTVMIDPGPVPLNPVIHTEIFEMAGSKVGYMVYVGFNVGENNIWINELGRALESFKAANIDQLILDLRYNPGGDLVAAEYLASALAPVDVVRSEEVFVKLEYNDQLDEYFREIEGRLSGNLVKRFGATELNLDLDRVLFLTSGATASASELVIAGLRPYMDVEVLGEQTLGKFYGSWVIYDLEEPPAHNWAIVPVVFKYANALGVTDFENGLDPDIPIADNLLTAKPFGDQSDPMLSLALASATGDLGVMQSARTSFKEKPYKLLLDDRKFARGNIMFGF